MKIAVEIKDGKFTYDYSISEHSSGHGDMPIVAENLCWFTEILNNCHKQFMHKSKKDMDEMYGMAYIETHPECIEKYIASGRYKPTKKKVTKE